MELQSLEPVLVLQYSSTVVVLYTVIAIIVALHKAIKRKNYLIQWYVCIPNVYC